MLHPLALTPLLAEVDLGQVVTVIVFLAVIFINWLINLWKQKQEAAERDRHMPTEDETEMRRKAWAEQTKKIEEPPTRLPQHPPSPASPTTGGSLKELFEELKRAAQEAQAPSPPPMPAHPHPQRPHQPSHRPVAPPLPTAASRAHQAPPLSPASRPQAPARTTVDGPLQTHAASAALASHAYDTKLPSRRNSHPLAALLHTSAGYQQAFILKEILDTPKGIRNTPWDNDPS
ncbi:hypothetical protein [Roseimicrobium sp. ORNL1]|uniref:hypothetical protein n=1 Tax=Roseimicrobium sp. ORNL1 TaxID=2711231 RepID=UPI0013E1C027|nr:hypothetical protein [Roseimicrobium sp. ORNL1]QIF02833.1 hypothetical protein G5S37_15320 [Roseimicrobium sp. ORNL1]